MRMIAEALFSKTVFNCSSGMRSVRVAERLALQTSVHGVAGSNPTGGEILPEPKRRFIAQSLPCSPFHRLEMTEILLKERKTLTHPSIHPSIIGHASFFHFALCLFARIVLCVVQITKGKLAFRKSENIEPWYPP